MQSPQESVLAIQYFIEADSQITQTDGDCIPLRDEFNGVDHVRAWNAWLWLHLDSVIDANHSHVSLKENHLVNLFEVVDLLYLAVVDVLVAQLGRLLVTHVHLCGILSVILDLVLDQVRGQVCKLDRWRVNLV